jgi:hypothetical protein
MGIDFEGAMKTSSSDLNVEKFLNSYVAANKSTDIDAYNNAKTLYALLKNLIGDDAFSKTNSGTASTYSLKLNPLAVTHAFAKTALIEGIPLLQSDLVQIKESLDSVDFNLDILINSNNNKLGSYNLVGDLAYQDTKANFTLSGTQMSANMEMGVIAKDMLEINMILNSLREETTKAVDLSLPAGSKIIDYNNLIK